MTEMRLYDLRVTVERIEGRSACGLEVGDYFDVTESSRVRIPEGKHLDPTLELGTPQGRTPLAGVELICDRVLPLLG